MHQTEQLYRQGKVVSIYDDWGCLLFSKDIYSLRKLFKPDVRGIQALFAAYSVREDSVSGGEFWREPPLSRTIS